MNLKHCFVRDCRCSFLSRIPNFRSGQTFYCGQTCWLVTNRGGSWSNLLTCQKLRSSDYRNTENLIWKFNTICWSNFGEKLFPHPVQVIDHEKFWSRIKTKVIDKIFFKKQLLDSEYAWFNQYLTNVLSNHQLLHCSNWFLGWADLYRWQESYNLKVFIPI